MSCITLDQRSALVLIDLQKGILALPTVVPADTITKQARRLVDAFRATGLPVARVKVPWSADGGDLPHTRADKPGPVTAPPQDLPPHR